MLYDFGFKLCDFDNCYYKELNDDDKIIYLTNVIDYNNAILNDIDKKCDYDDVIKEDNIYHAKEPIIEKDLDGKKFPNFTLEQFLNYSNYHDMIKDGLLPEDKSIYSTTLVNQLILVVINELENYKLLEEEDYEGLFTEERIMCERLLNILKDYKNTLVDNKTLVKKG